MHSLCLLLHVKTSCLQPYWLNIHANRLDGSRGLYNVHKNTCNTGDKCKNKATCSMMFKGKVNKFLNITTLLKIFVIIN